jgi:hypothetical protein
MCLLSGNGLQCDIAAAIRYFTLSGENGNSDGWGEIGWMTENGINTTPDFVAAARYDKFSGDHSIAGAFHFGRCCQSGWRVPVDLVSADRANAELFASDERLKQQNTVCARLNVEWAVVNWRLEIRWL